MPDPPEREAVMIGTAAETCPWDWDRVRAMLESGLVDAKDLGHCPWCKRFFESRKGLPRKRQTKGGRRFGTWACYEAWRQDEVWRTERLGE